MKSVLKNETWHDWIKDNFKLKYKQNPNTCYKAALCHYPFAHKKINYSSHLGVKSATPLQHCRILIGEGRTWDTKVQPKHNPVALDTKFAGKYLPPAGYGKYLWKTSRPYCLQGPRQGCFWGSRAAFTSQWKSSSLTWISIWFPPNHRFITREAACGQGVQD